MNRGCSPDYLYFVSNSGCVDSSNTDSLTPDEAKAYLLSYKDVETNRYNKEFVKYYEFATRQDLERAVAYICEYGLDVFHNEVDAAVKEVVAQEEKTQTSVSRTVDPLVVNRTISGNGIHTVSGM